MMKKKNVISPLFTHSRRVCDRPAPPRWIDSGVRHTPSYDAIWMFAQASAANVAPSKTAALPDSVRRKARSGVWTPRSHAVRPTKGVAEAPGSVIAPMMGDEGRLGEPLTANSGRDGT